MNVHSQVIENALSILIAQHPRATYAADVLTGHKRWSGSDLKGKAARYGSSYARSRRYAYSALLRAGGCIIAQQVNGLLCSAVVIGADDYGNALYATGAGPFVAGKKGRCRPV